MLVVTSDDEELLLEEDAVVVGLPDTAPSGADAAAERVAPPPPAVPLQPPPIEEVCEDGPPFPAKPTAPSGRRTCLTRRPNPGSCSCHSPAGLQMWPDGACCRADSMQPLLAQANRAACPLA